MLEPAPIHYDLADKISMTINYQAIGRSLLLSNDLQYDKAFSIDYSTEQKQETPDTDMNSIWVTNDHLTLLKALTPEWDDNDASYATGELYGEYERIAELLDWDYERDGMTWEEHENKIDKIQSELGGCLEILMQNLSIDTGLYVKNGDNWSRM
jgi:hypothetical protein